MHDYACGAGMPMVQENARSAPAINDGRNGCDDGRVRMSRVACDGIKQDIVAAPL